MCLNICLALILSFHTCRFPKTTFRLARRCCRTSSHRIVSKPSQIQRRNTRMCGCRSLSSTRGRTKRGGKRHFRSTYLSDVFARHCKDLLDAELDKIRLDEYTCSATCHKRHVRGKCSFAPRVPAKARNNTCKQMV